MALEVHDRVKETTTTTGSSDAYALGGAVTGFETFGSHLVMLIQLTMYVLMAQTLKLVEVHIILLETH